MNVTPQTKVAVGCFMYSIYTNMSLQGFGLFPATFRKTPQIYCHQMYLSLLPL